MSGLLCHTSSQMRTFRKGLLYSERYISSDNVAIVLDTVHTHIEIADMLEMLSPGNCCGLRDRLH